MELLKTLKKDADTTLGIAENDVEIQLINGGLYYSFWNRFSLLGGYQASNIKNNISNFEWVETAMAAGLEYKLKAGLYAVVKYTRLDVEKNSTTINDEAATVPVNVEYSQDFVKAAIRVQF